MYFGFEDISISYEKKEVINHLSIEFEKGSITTIIGKNGCGKSSLLKTIVGNVKFKGKIKLLDNNIKKYKRKDIAKKIAYLPQIHTSPTDIDVKTLISYGRYPHKRFGHTLSKHDNEIIFKAMEYAGLINLMDQRVETLSGGELQRAWIAMAIAQEPEILILDEPTTYLDLCYQIEILELIKKLNNDGMTIIMVLHDLNLAARYSSYLYAIKNKNIYKKGKPKDVITKETLEELFDIKANVFSDTKNNCPYFIVESKGDKNEN